MEAYINIVKKILNEGTLKKNRTGIDTISISGMLFEHDMEKGFPLLTTKKVPLRLVASELEFFIKGITDKSWLQNEDNHIWDEWCTPKKVSYGNDEETKQKMKQEKDLGPIYGWQWKHFGAKYIEMNKEPEGKGINQLKELIHQLKTNPDSRRMIVIAWNPVDLKEMALPPCHYCFQVTITDGKLNLMWNQRSVDVALGLPFNIASYALLLHLLAKECNLKEGRLVGFLADTHIYTNHVEGLKQQIERKPYPLPKIKTENFKSIFEWNYKDTIVEDYESHPRIKFEVAV